MSGVRMGERILQIGIDDARLASLLAAKVGLSGHAAVAVADDAAGERAHRAGADAGVLIEVHVTPLDTLPFGDGEFDVVVVHGRSGLLPSLAASTRVGALRECRRVLRHGGRLLAIEDGDRAGLAAILRPRRSQSPEYDAAGGTLTALQGAGFTAVRLLAEREGYRFTEGLNGSSQLPTPNSQPPSSARN
jgi:SAM-dependent methyltransferase